jgi:hypothetical protein
MFFSAGSALSVCYFKILNLAVVYNNSTLQLYLFRLAKKVSLYVIRSCKSNMETVDTIL